MKTQDPTLWQCCIDLCRQFPTSGCGHGVTVAETRTAPDPLPRSQWNHRRRDFLHKKSIPTRSGHSSFAVFNLFNPDVLNLQSKHSSQGCLFLESKCSDWYTWRLSLRQNQFKWGSCMLQAVQILEYGFRFMQRVVHLSIGHNLLSRDWSASLACENLPLCKMCRQCSFLYFTKLFVGKGVVGKSRRVFIGPMCTWGPIIGSTCLYLCLSVCLSLWDVFETLWRLSMLTP